MTGRIIKTAADWERWGTPVEGTVIVDDWQTAYQYDHHAWYGAGHERETDTATENLQYPVEVVWVPSDRDLLHWPEETP